MKKNIQRLARQLLKEVDDTGRRLRKPEINFVADLIDSPETIISEEQFRQIRSIHRRRCPEREEE